MTNTPYGRPMRCSSQISRTECRASQSNNHRPRSLPTLLRCTNLSRVVLVIAFLKLVLIASIGYKGLLRIQVLSMLPCDATAESSRFYLFVNVRNRYYWTPAQLAIL